jgi:putative ABC transport system permease protein
MSPGELLDALRVLFADRARAALTLLGIVIGAGSIVLLASLMSGGEEALIGASQQAVDADLVKIRRDDPPVSERTKTRRSLSRADARLLAGSEVLGGAETGGESDRRTRAVFEGRKKRVSLISGTPGSRTLYGLTVARGRFLGDDDLEDHRRVCVVGAEVWTELLQSHAALGEARIEAEGRLWTVIGVLAKKPILGNTDSTDIWDRRVLVPETTFDAALSPSHTIDRLYVRRRHPPAPAIVTPMEAFRRVIAATLLRRHLGVHDFKLDQEQGKGQERLILEVIKSLLLATGLIALFVGGINIMNILLVTVTERTREIGIRRAVGASPRRILLQFLIESALLSLIGGLLGVLAGALVAWLASVGLAHLVGSWRFHLEGWSIALGLGLSVLTGLVFGIYPAWRAARLDPIEALRSE